MLQIELPPQLHTEFVQRARALYTDDDSVSRALIEAIEAWLARHQNPFETEEYEANNRAYEELREVLQRDHWGKWVVIAYGKLQGIGDTIEEVDQFARDANMRIVTLIGEERPKEVELGWEATFQQFAG